MYVLAVLRFCLEPSFLLGVLLEVAAAVIGTALLRDDPLVAQMLARIWESCQGKLPELPDSASPLLRKGGVVCIRPFILACIVCLVFDVRRTLYMASADFSSVSLLRPILVYANVLLYLIMILLSFMILIAVRKPASRYAYADAATAGAFLERADRPPSFPAGAGLPGGGAPVDLPVLGAVPGVPADAAAVQAEQARRELEEARRTRQMQYMAGHT